MPEVEVKGKSLEEIRITWAQKWGCTQDKLKIEVLDEPGFFTKQWKVRVSLVEERPDPTPRATRVRIFWQEDRFIIQAEIDVKRIIPFPLAGIVYLNGQPQEQPFGIIPTDQIEFCPFIEPGELTWSLEVRNMGLSAIAKVTHKKPGYYKLPLVIDGIVALDLQKHLLWENLDFTGECWTEDKLNKDLADLKIVYGQRSNIWKEILDVEGVAEVTVAEALLPVDPQFPVVEDYVGQIETQEDTDEDRVDFYGSKVTLVEEGAILARKLPGTSGTPGIDIFGREIPTKPFKDRDFQLKKNVRLSEDGLEVIASCGGLPRRIQEWAYSVDNVYVLNSDVDLASGSIEFPGDVMVYGNVQDGFHIYSGGKVEVNGSVSKGEIRAENGLRVFRNILASKVIVGENYVNRSQLLKYLTAVKDELNLCLDQAESLAASGQVKQLNPSQCLKLLLERKFQDLPKKASDLESFVLNYKGEYSTQELIVAVRTIKHFLNGLGPLDPQSIPLLKKAGQVTAYLSDNISLEVPEKLACKVDYVQGATIDCAGDFECRKGSYNSTIRANGDVKIEGVCRGGAITGEGNIYIRELGGSGVSTTTVQLSGQKTLKVDLCHPNVVIIVDKQIIRIEEVYKEMVVYREKGIVQVEKLRVL